MIENGRMRGALVLLAIVGVMAPFSNWAVSSSTSLSSSNDSGHLAKVTYSTSPALNAEELRIAIEKMTKSLELDSTSIKPKKKHRSKNFSASRDPFDLPRLPSKPTITEFVAPDLPDVILLGIIRGRHGDVATLKINGRVLTLEKEQSAAGITLVSVSPPDSVRVKFDTDEIEEIRIR